MDWRIGVTNLLSPENCTLLLIDHQGYQFSGVQNIDGTLLINNVVGLTKTAKVFGVPTVLTTVLEERGGFILKDIQDVFPYHTLIASLLHKYASGRLREA